MLKFLLFNPTKFACGSIALPAMICLFKCTIVIFAEIACIMLLVSFNDPLSTLKKFGLMIVIAKFDSKLIDIFAGIDSDDMKESPLQFICVSTSGKFFPATTEYAGRIKAGSVLSRYGQIVLMWFLELCEWVLSVFYNTVYFYFTPFLPIMWIICNSALYRNSPEV